MGSNSKEYQKRYIRKHYKENKAYYIEKSRLYKKEIREWLRDLKKTLKCELCGEDHWACLDFHHPDTNKEGSVSRMVGQYGKTRILKEISKCLVVCSNCHRKIHFAPEAEGIQQGSSKP